MAPGSDILGRGGCVEFEMSELVGKVVDRIPRNLLHRFAVMYESTPHQRPPGNVAQIWSILANRAAADAIRHHERVPCTQSWEADAIAMHVAMA